MLAGVLEQETQWYAALCEDGLGFCDGAVSMDSLSKFRAREGVLACAQPGEGEQPWRYPAGIQPSNLQIRSQPDKLGYAITLTSENQIFKFPSPPKKHFPTLCS